MCSVRFEFYVFSTWVLVRFGSSQNVGSSSVRSVRFPSLKFFACPFASSVSLWYRVAHYDVDNFRPCLSLHLPFFAFLIRLLGGSQPRTNPYVATTRFCCCKTKPGRDLFRKTGTNPYSWPCRTHEAGFWP